MEEIWNQLQIQRRGAKDEVSMLVGFKIGSYMFVGPNEADMSCVVVGARMGTGGHCSQFY